jgi:hypothetical protein
LFEDQFIWYMEIVWRSIYLERCVF